MTKKERFLTAVRGGIPDVVPVAPLIDLRFTRKLLGEYEWEVMREKGTKAIEIGSEMPTFRRSDDWKVVFEAHKRIGSTFFRGPIFVGINSNLGEQWGEETELIEKQGTRQIYKYTLRTPKGNLEGKEVVGAIPHDPLASKRVEYPVKKHEDWRIYQEYWEHWLENAGEPILDQVIEAYKVTGEEGVASVGIIGVYACLGEARGLEEILYDLYDSPDLIKELSNVILKVIEKKVKAFLSSPADVLWYDICWATGSNMSPKFFEKFALPNVQRVISLVCTKPGKYVGLYTLGKIKEILPMLVEAEPHFIETFEQNQGDISLREAKEKYGDRICIMGNFDPVILARGTPQEARKETLRCLREGAEGGGYVLVTGDEVPADAKPENLKIMVQTVEEYGRY